MAKSEKVDTKQYLIAERLLNDTIAVLKAAIHSGVTWQNVNNLIEQLQQCKPVEEDS